MTIETKYNIGDEVWCIKNNAPTTLTITKVIAYSSSRGKHCWYKLSNKSYLPEYELYPTREELLKSL